MKTFQLTIAIIISGLALYHMCHILCDLPFLLHVSCDDHQTTITKLEDIFYLKEVSVETHEEHNKVVLDDEGIIDISSYDSVSSNSTVELSASTISPYYEEHNSKSAGKCDLYRGKWIYNSAGPLYNSSCPVINPEENCQGNGRPDKDYENWRWKPEQCNLPYFDAKRFLELMRDKTLAFVGDSLARNQMESLVCLLWQVETPVNRGNRRIQRWRFWSTNTTIIRKWSSWLVHRTNPGDASHPSELPADLVGLHLNLPDREFMELLPMFDVVVLNFGHWFTRQSAYILGGTVVGGQNWWWSPENYADMQINNTEAFAMSIETSLTAIADNPKFKGLAVVCAYSPDHFEGGKWDTNFEFELWSFLKFGFGVDY